MPQVPQVNEVRRISFNQLREILEEAFQEVLALLPVSNEPEIDLAYERPTGELVPLADAGIELLGILVNFVSSVGTLSENYSVAEVKKLLVEKGVAQMIVSGNETWYQLYVD